MTDSAIAWGVAVGRLHLVFREAFAIGHPREDQRSRMFAAVLCCGAGSVVSHGTAAALLGLQDVAPALVDVTAPGQAGRKIGGIRHHNVPLPSAGETTQHDAIPCTSVPRTIVDLAAHCGERRLRRLVEQAAVLRQLDLAEIDAVMARRGRSRGSPMLRAILADWRRASAKPRLRSPLEARLLPLIAAAGLPAPLCNHVVHGLEVDLLWPRQRLVVEADGGAFHDNPIAFERDRRRDRDLALAGYRVLRVTWRQLEDEAEKTVETVARLLA